MGAVSARGGGCHESAYFATFLGTSLLGFTAWLGVHLDEDGPFGQKKGCAAQENVPLFVYKWGL